MPLHSCHVTVLAGSKTSGLADGRGDGARFKNPGGIKVDAQGNIFLSDMANGRICKITHDGEVTTFAGNPGAGAGVGNPCTIQIPAGFSIDEDGSIVFTDMGFHQVRRATVDGSCSVLAGSGTNGYRDGPALSAQFVRPHAVAILPDRTLMVADSDDCRLRRVSSSGIVSTFCGKGYAGHLDGPLEVAEFNKPSGVRPYRNGLLVVSDAANNCIRQISPYGMVTTLTGCPEAGLVDGPSSVARFNHPSAMAFDGYDNIIVSDVGNNCLRMVTPDGYTSTLRMNSPEAPKDSCSYCCLSPAGIEVDACGDIVVASFKSHRIFRVHAGLQPPRRPTANLLLLERILSDNTCADLCFVVEGHRFLAHRCIVAAGWRSCPPPPDLTSDPSAPHEIPIVDTDPDTFRAFLRFLYTGELSGLDILFPLLRLFSHFDVQEGCDRCLRLCQMYINPLNAVEWLLAAQALGLLDALRCITPYILKHCDRIQADAPDTLARLERCPEALHALRCTSEPENAGPAPLHPAPSSPPTRLLKQLWLEKRWTDVTFVVGEDRIAAHRCVLAARCEYFATLLAAGFMETYNADIPLCDATALAWRAFLHFLYTDELCDDDEVIDVMQLCHTYSHTDGYDRCLQHCMQHISPQNAVPWLVASHFHGLEDLSLRVLPYVQKHCFRIQSDFPDTFALLQPHPDLLAIVSTAIAPEDPRGSGTAPPSGPGGSHCGTGSAPAQKP